MLKVGWRHDEALHEADGLRAWGGRGAVRLVDALVAGETSALLLEACEPGTVLSQVLSPLEQDAVVAGLLRRLWIEPPVGHPDNVLAARREPWLVIDPKPYLGDPTYDPLQHMLDFPDRLVADPAGFAQRMADLLDLDGARLRQWLFVRCVQESIDQPDLRSVVLDLAP